MSQQPKALRILIPTEMAEVYSYFSLQAILIFYLLNKLSYSDANAYLLSGHFIAFAYLMPTIGGWVADRFLGNRMAIFLGMLLLSLGYALLIFGEHSLLMGLSLIIVGNGLFKATMSSFIGEFYHHNDPRREAGFTLVFAGVNIGSLLATSCVGYIQKWFGWGACFGVSCFVLLAALSFFQWGSHYFNNKGLPPHHLRNKWIILFWLCLALCIIYFAMKFTYFGNFCIVIFSLAFCLYLAKIFWQSATNNRKNLLALIILFIIAIYYKAMFFETYLVINVFTDRLVDKKVFGHDIPATSFLAFGSLVVIVLGPLFAYLWQSKKILLPTSVKFALSILIAGSCMQILATWLTIDTTAMLPAASILCFRFLFAVSELFILPLGLSVVTEYAPKNHVGLMMGGWYITAALGGKLAGTLAQYANIPNINMDLHDLKIFYHHVFQHYALLNFAIFVTCLLLVPVINKLLKRE